MGDAMTVEELKKFLADEELLKDLPISKQMIDFIVELIRRRQED